MLYGARISYLYGNGFSVLRSLVCLADLRALDLAAQCFRQLVHVLDDTGVLVGGCGVLYVVLQFLGQLRTGGIALCQNNGCLDNLSADGIRCSGDGAFNDCRMLDEGAFYLERADAVAGALDNIVIPTNE